jgi:hypothetical protein
MESAYLEEVKKYYEIKKVHDARKDEIAKEMKKYKREQEKSAVPLKPFKPSLPLCPSCSRPSNNITFKRSSVLFYGCDKCDGKTIPLQRGYLMRDYLDYTNKNLTYLKQQMIRQKVAAKYGYGGGNVEDLVQQYTENDIWKATFEKHIQTNTHEDYERKKREFISKIKSSIKSKLYPETVKQYNKLQTSIDKYEKKHFVREIVDKQDQMLYTRQPLPLVNLIVSEDIINLKPSKVIKQDETEELHDEEDVGVYKHPSKINITMKTSAKSMKSCPDSVDDVWDIPAELLRSNKYESNHSNITIEGKIYDSSTYDAVYNIHDSHLDKLFEPFISQLTGTGMLIIQYGFNKGYLANYLHKKGYTAVVISITNTGNYLDHYAKIALDMKLTNNVKHILIRGYFVMDKLPEGYTTDNTLIVIDEPIDSNQYMTNTFETINSIDENLIKYKHVYAIGEGLSSSLFYDSNKLYIRYKSKIAKISKPKFYLTDKGKQILIPENEDASDEASAFYSGIIKQSKKIKSFIKYYHELKKGKTDEELDALKKTDKVYKNLDVLYSKYPDVVVLPKPDIPDMKLEDYIRQNTTQTLEGESTSEGLKFIAKYKTDIMFEIGFNTGKSANYLLDSVSALMSFDLGQHDYVYAAKQYIDDKHPNKHILVLGDSKISMPLTIRYIIQKKYDSAIFIDGNHLYNGACSDLLNSSKFVDTIVLDNVAPHKGAGIQVYLAMRHYLEGNLEGSHLKYIGHKELKEYADGIAVLSSKYKAKEFNDRVAKTIERRMRFVKLVAENTDHRNDAEIAWLRSLEGDYTDNK